MLPEPLASLLGSVIALGAFPLPDRMPMTTPGAIASRQHCLDLGHPAGDSPDKLEHPPISRGMAGKAVVRHQVYQVTMPVIIRWAVCKENGPITKPETCTSGDG